MANIGFSYIPLDYINEAKVVETIFRPYIQIRLSHIRNNPTHFVDALLDSGSDKNLFPKQWGDLMGINFKKIQPKYIHGIGGVTITAYTSKVNIWVDGTKYETEADFSDQQQTPLLGRSGFFNLFKEVVFDENKRFVYLEL